MRKIAFFDFDGTLYKGDSFLYFCKQSKRYYYWGLFMLSPFILSFYLGWLPAKELKNRFLKYFFKGYSEEDYLQLANNFSKSLDAKRIEVMWEKLEVLRRNEFEICIVSASLQSYLQPWCTAHNFKLLCTQVKWDSYPKVAGENCNYDEKVKAIEKAYDLSGYQKILAFGDSKGDAAMLKLQRV